MIDSIFDARFEIYDTLIQRKSNLEIRVKELQKEIDELDAEIKSMKED